MIEPQPAARRPHKHKHKPHNQSKPQHPHQIIAIFAQPSHDAAPGCGGRCEYVAASYVKWAEAAGARAVPVPYNATAPVLDALFERVNGLLLPGGGNPLPEAAVHMLGRALAANAAGGYFPVRVCFWVWRGSVGLVVGLGDGCRGSVARSIIDGDGTALD